MSQVLQYESPDRTAVPTSVQVVAWVFIAIGILAIIRIPWGLYHDRLKIGLDLFGILLGRGLLRRREWALRWSVLLIDLTVVVGILVVLLSILLYKPESFSLLGYTLHGVPATAVRLAIIVVISVACCWMHRVLSRESVQELFRKPRMTPHERDRLARQIERGLTE